MRTCHELAYILSLEYPDLKNGSDYWVAHPVDQETLAQTGDPFIAEWKSTSTPKPTDEELAAIIAKHADACDLAVAETAAIRKCDALLIDADKILAEAEDDEDTDKVSACRAYRKALRAVKDQPGYPNDISWPTPPAD